MKFRRFSFPFSRGAATPPICLYAAATMISMQMIVLKVDGKEIILTEDQAFAYNEPGLRAILTTLYEAEKGAVKASAARVSDALGESPSTVRDRLRRLALHGLVVRKSDKTYALTDPGRQLADALLEQEKIPKARVKKDE